MAQYGPTVITDNPAIEIKPGLISLNLGIIHTLDLHMIEEAKLEVIQAKTVEHPMLRNVQNNIIALLQTKIPRERHIARKTLEDIIQENPCHLNALADLEYIYRDLNRISDANTCQNAIDNILAGTSKTHMDNKKISLLEQGYAIRMEKDLINENTIDLKVSELQTIITTELKNSSGKRKHCLAKSLKCNKQMLQHLQDARKHRTLDEHIIRSNSSVQKYETVLTLFPDEELHPVWKFNFAKSLNQYSFLIESMSDIDNIDRTVEITEVTVRAIKLFWKTTEELVEQDMSLYVARSFAYIGHILTKRNQYLFAENKITGDLLSIPDISDKLNKPSIILQKAYDLAPEDVTVLNRYGRSLWNESQALEGKEKVDALKKAEKLLTESIESENKRNRFAYCSRLAVRKDIAKSLPQSERAYSMQYFELAREDGIQCFRSKCTLKDMNILAEVCQNLAKYPDITKYGPRFVKLGKRELIVEAIDYLYYGLRLGDTIDYHSASRMSMCLADLGEYSKAIEWQKRAWLLAKRESTWPVVMLCFFLTILIEEESKKPSKQINHLLKDFMYVLKHAKDQYSSENINKIYTYLHKRRHAHVLNVFISCMDELCPFDIKTKEVISDYVWHLFKFLTLSKEERRIAEKIVNLLSQKPTTENREENFQSIFESKSCQQSKNTESISLEYKYDFFVCHSHLNGEWINSMLLPYLENAYEDEDITLKGCIADRDFQPGKTILKNIVEAILGSSKIIVIITPDFLDSTWCQFEIEHALLDGTKQNRIIPVLLQACGVPDELKHFTYMDITDDENNLIGLQKIKNAII